MSGGLGFSADNGVLALLGSAVSGRRDEDYKFYLEGDLSQMSAQDSFLRDRGFDVGRSDVYPVLRTEKEFSRAVRLIWEHKVEGWWHYRERLIEDGVCTGEEFDSALSAAVEEKRSR